MSVSETIKKKLVEAFEPTRLDVIDESHLLAGHVGARPEGETHFRLIISSDFFSGKRVSKNNAKYTECWQMNSQVQYMHSA